MHSTTTTVTERGGTPRLSQRRVMIVDDDEVLSDLFARALIAKGYRVQCARDGLEAARLLEEEAFDIILTDVSMPEMTGIELLEMVRRHDLDVPVVLITGAPDIQSAASAVEYGAFRYLEKPVSTKTLLDVVGRASQVHELARLKRRAMALLRDHVNEASDRAGLMSAFSDSLRALFMHFQPIVLSSNRSVFAYEALVRSPNTTLPDPPALLKAGERLGRTTELGRVIRERVAEVMSSVPDEQLIFVNLHPLELADDELVSPNAPLSAFASRVVLEVTERARLEDIPNLDARINALRSMGYRLAVDDLGAGYAGLTSFVRLNPEFVKIDMTLTRDVDRSESKQALIRSAVELCREMSIRAIVEGVETKEELRALTAVGADLLQGYLFGRPDKLSRSVDYEAFEC